MQGRRVARLGGQQPDVLEGPDGACLARLPGHIAYWFAWRSFLLKAPLAEVE